MRALAVKLAAGLLLAACDRPQPPADAGPTWHVASPVQRAESLANEFRAMGAAVATRPAPPCTLMQIDAPEGVPRQKTAAHLAAQFKTPLDAQGRAELRVCPPRP